MFSFEDAVYRVVLLAFPAAFRRRHGIAMIDQFREQRRAVRGRPLARVALWVRATTDGIRHGLGLRLERPVRPPRRSAMSTDIHHALRSLASRRSSTALSVGLLGIALAVSTTIFGVVDALVLRPAPFPNAHNLAELYVATESTTGVPRMPPELTLLWQERTDLFAAVGAAVQGGAALLGPSGASRQWVAQAFISPGLIELLGVRPSVGRSFVAGEGAPGNDRTAIISESLWQSHFNRDPSAIGGTLLVNNEPLVVVGIMPAPFQYPYASIRLWRPLDLQSTERLTEVVVRTHGDRDRETLQDEVAVAAAQIMPRANRPSRYTTARLRFIDQARIADRHRQSLWLLFGATVLLLLTACANVSSLTMAQVFGRVRDNAVQAALGASRSRLMRQAFIEQAWLGVLSLALAAPLMYAGVAAAGALIPNDMLLGSLNVVDVDGRVMAVLAVLALATPLVAGIVPAFVGSRASVVEVLKHDSRSSTSGRGSRLFRQSLVVAEIACAVVLLAAGALLVRSFLGLQAVDRGFDSTKLVRARVLHPSMDFPSALSVRLHTDRLLEHLKALPGVNGATLTSGMPPAFGQISFTSLVLDDRPGQATDTFMLPGYTVRPDFFSVTGIPILQGRAFRDDDTTEQVIVSQSLARTLWPEGSPLGRRYRFAELERWYEVVGVAGDVRSAGLDEPYGAHEVYLPYTRPAVSAISTSVEPSTEAFSGSASFVVRVDDAAAALPAIRDALTRSDDRVMVDSVAVVEDSFQGSLARQRLLLALMVAFSAAGLIVAAAGVYGVLSGLVAQRSREIGVRLMLGAEPRAMARSVLRSGLVLAGLGAVIGVVVAAAIGRFISGMLFDVQPTDVVSYVIVLLVLGAAAVGAAWHPARRAARVDPATLLRLS
jgi:predicted permease